ncbi:hypothetical protein KFU94_01835 [Chloroflexi bacterium TSY]|nr:hypothetical protein [Chloroflexi bacterium TSY]MBV7327005.1 hypothetical protein [Chloroflexi bacterium TSY]
MQVDDEQIQAQLEPLPLDIVLQLVDYLDPIERVSWLEKRTVGYKILEQE